MSVSVVLDVWQLKLDRRLPGTWQQQHTDPSIIFQAESKRRAAQEDARINRERADLKRAEAERLKRAEKMNAGNDLVSETGFWNLGATSEKVHPDSQLCCIAVGWLWGVGHTCRCATCCVLVGSILRGKP